MLRKLALIALVPLLAAASPALAVTAKEKQETCKVGAESQELTGAKRAAFMKKCMAQGNFEPPGRKVAKKPAKKPKKPAAMAPRPPADAVPPPPKQ
jgi:psiF repeat-containing protein